MKYLIFAVCFVFLFVTGCSKCKREKTPQETQSQEANKVNLPPDRSKPYKPDYSQITLRRVIQKVLRPSKSSVTANNGSVVTINYTGWVYDPVQLGNKGWQFMHTTKPLTITVGKGQVIRGLDQSLVGMRVGEIREFIIPSDLGYGSQEHDKIPPGSHLLLEVELLKTGKR